MRILVHTQSLYPNHRATLLLSIARILTPETLWLLPHHTRCSSGSPYPSVHTISSPVNAPGSTLLMGPLCREESLTLPSHQGKVNPSILLAPIDPAGPLSPETLPPRCRCRSQPSGSWFPGNRVLVLLISICPGSSSVFGTWTLSANTEWRTKWTEKPHQKSNFELVWRASS